MSRENSKQGQPQLPGWKAFVCVVAAVLLAKLLELWLSPRLSLSIAWFVGWVLFYEVPPRSSDRNFAKTLLWSALSALFIVIVNPR